MLERNTSGDEQVKFDFARRAAEAHELWASLAVAQTELNGTARGGAVGLSLRQKDMLQKLFKRVSKLVDAEYLGICPIVNTDEILSVGDALLLLGQHKAALRLYRVHVLSEDPFSLR